MDQQKSINCFEQQKMAKLSLLILDDKNIHEEQDQNIDENMNWGRSLQTQSYLRKKLSNRYKQKRRSLRHLKPKSGISRQLNQKKPINLHKQSLKELLCKLQSKQIHKSDQQTLRHNTVEAFCHQVQRKRNKNQSLGAILQQRNRVFSQKRRLKQTIEDKQNNFFSKKIDIKINKNSSYKVLEQSNTKFQPLCDLKTYFNEQNPNSREYLTQSKQQTKRKDFVLKKNQNKQNQTISLLQFPVQTYQNYNLLSKFIKSKNQNQNNEYQWQKNRSSRGLSRRQKGSIKQNFPKKCEFIENQLINKRTFQILQQINRTKSINGIKKLTSQSLKYRKPQLHPYSKVSKDRSSLIEENNEIRSINTSFFENRGSLLKSTKPVKQKIQNYWVKLQIRR